LARIAGAVLLSHLRLKSASLSPAHLRGRQAQISNLLQTDLLNSSPDSPLPEYHSSSTTCCVETSPPLYLDHSDWGILFSKNHLSELAKVI
jgi:hypothetical protein